MAQLAEEHSLAAVPQQQPTTATSMSLAELSEEDDEDEYEYEYSVTETEVTCSVLLWRTLLTLTDLLRHARSYHPRCALFTKT